MKRSGTRHLLVVCCLSISFKLIAAERVMTYIHNAPESEFDKRYEFTWEILNTALDKTVTFYGPYRMLSSERMTEKRQVYELEQGSGKITIMCLGSTPSLEKALHSIRIPVDKNLNGYELFLIRKEDGSRFKDVKSIEDLKKFKYGLGFGWIDAEILKSNGFSVVTGSNYEGLFEMLKNKRFDVFLRSSEEILDEFETRKDEMPDLMIQENILIYYPLPMYFWFSNNDEGKRLASRVEKGMRMMIADGTYDRIFAKHENEKIVRLKLKSRKLFKIDNPFIGPAAQLDDKKLWFDPRTYRVRSSPR
jgi:hypothetical protein